MSSFKLHFFSCFCVLHNSTFMETRDQFGSVFRLYNLYAVFVYGQLQNNLPDSFLGVNSTWKNYLAITLYQSDLSFKTPNEFVLNTGYHHLLATSKLPSPSKFVEQTILFCKSFCGILLSHEIIKSYLIRGLSCLASAVIPGTEGQYVSAVECLRTQFVGL